MAPLGSIHWIRLDFAQFSSIWPSLALFGSLQLFSTLLDSIAHHSTPFYALLLYPTVIDSMGFDAIRRDLSRFVSIQLDSTLFYSTLFYSTLFCSALPFSTLFYCILSILFYCVQVYSIPSYPNLIYSTGFDSTHLDAIRLKSAPFHSIHPQSAQIGSIQL